MGRIPADLEGSDWLLLTYLTLTPVPPFLSCLPHRPCLKGIADPRTVPPTCSCRVSYYSPGELVTASPPCSGKFWLQAQSLYVQISPPKRVNAVGGFKVNNCGIRKRLLYCNFNNSSYFCGGDGLGLVLFTVTYLTIRVLYVLIFLNIFDVCMLGGIF